MTGAIVIDGAAIAAQIKPRVAALAAEFKAAAGRCPGLAAVLVGENPASQVYVRNKLKLARETGLQSSEHRLAESCGEAELLELIAALNADPDIDGILVQLPLPAHIEASAAIAAIDPAKDVDGFTVGNAGRLFIGRPAFIPCTPLGCLHLISTVRPELSGLHAVVLGRSNIVGKPMAHLLLSEDCTVTLAHSKTRNLPSVAAQADILVAAVGQPEMVRGDWIKPGATVIDVGISRVAAAGGKLKLVGDVHFDSAREVAGAITPVPGGVGPMTVAYLMINTCRSAFLRQKLSWDAGLLLA